MADIPRRGYRWGSLLGQTRKWHRVRVDDADVVGQPVLILKRRIIRVNLYGTGNSSMRGVYNKQPHIRGGASGVYDRRRLLYAGDREKLWEMSITKVFREPMRIQEGRLEHQVMQTRDDSDMGREGDVKCFYDKYKR
jgi:hypothetical protein